MRRSAGLWPLLCASGALAQAPSTGAVAADPIPTVSTATTVDESAVIVRPGEFRGENCAQCHASIRDRRPAPLWAASEPIDAGTYDVVVIGAGLSGLTAAHYLRDYKLLVLDKEAKVGGKMRRESFNGHPYAVAGIYMGAPEGAVADLFKDLGLKLDLIRFNSDHAINVGGKVVGDWIAGDPSRLPYPPAVQARFKKFQEKLKEFAAADKLRVPVETSGQAALEDLEPYAFYQWADNNYGPEVAGLADLYCRDIFGITAKEVSAAAGILYMMSEFTPSYMWEGGLGPASEALGRELGPSISTGVFVWRVSQGLDGATVDYHDGKRDYRARARAVVVAVSSLVGRRIIAGLPDWKKDAMEKVRYSSYAVVPMKAKSVLWDKSFVLWSPGRFFADVTMPFPSAELLKGATGQLLTAYIPMGESEGRQTLLKAKDEELVHKVLADLETLFTGGAAEIEEARVIRWGHAMPVLYPGFLTKIRPLLAKPEGRFFFAGVDTQVPAFEGAVASGLEAARQARAFLKAQERGR